MAAIPETEPGPVFVSLPTAFVIRNLALGSCLRRVLAERPVVAAVHPYAIAELERIFADLPLQCLPFHEPPASNGRDWQLLVHYLQEGSKGTSGVRASSRVYSPETSRAEQLGFLSIPGLLRVLGRGLSRFGLLPAIEELYLRRVRTWEVTETWRQILRRHRPAVVVTSVLSLANRGASKDLPLVVAARELGIPCATVMQSWDNLTCKTATLPPFLERYWAWSEPMKEQLRRHYPHVPEERVVAVGSPQFDFHRRPEMVEPRQTFAERWGLDPERPWVVIGTGSESLLPSEPAVVLDLVERLARSQPQPNPQPQPNAPPRPQVLIRLHPKDFGRRWKALRPRLDALGAVIQDTSGAFHMAEGQVVTPEDFYRQQVTTLHHAAVVLCSSSTLTVDAALLDRPVICLAYDAEADPRFPEGRARAFSEASHYAPLVATGGVTVCHRADAVLEAVGRFLRDPSLGCPERRDLVAQVTCTPDGGAGERLAAEILELAAERGSHRRCQTVRLT